MRYHLTRSLPLLAERLVSPLKLKASPFCETLLVPKTFARRLPKCPLFFTVCCSTMMVPDIAEYAVMVATILVIVVGTIRLVGSNANTVFSNVASAVQ